MIQVGILGGTGYTGVELLRLLAGHPRVGIEVIPRATGLGKYEFTIYNFIHCHSYSRGRR